MMRQFNRSVLWMWLVVFLSGCAWVHQDVTLRLDPKIVPSRVGAGITVLLEVLDKRESKLIGYRGMDSKLAKITTNQDVVELFHAKILEGLAQQGFKPVSRLEQSSRVLTVEIRQIEYSTSLDFWKGTARAKALLRASTTRDGLTYDQAYDGEQKETVLEAPGAETNQRLINAAITEAVQDLLADQRLTAFLAN